MHSMTGYGRGQVLEDGRQITVELKSVNHRFLDISYRLGHTLSFLEDTVRKSISDRLARGHVDVYVNYVNERSDAKQVHVDTVLAAAYRRAFDELASALGQENAVSITDYIRFPDVLKVEECEEDQGILIDLFTRACNQALDALIKMRKAEGERLRTDILEKVSAIRVYRDQIALRAPEVVNTYRDKLHQRLIALTNGELDEARFVTEVAIFADRAAIDEELVRIISHTDQICATVDLPEPAGRRLDFLVQELNREFNTIGSKASDAEIAKLVVLAKGEIEKLREQVQNIE